MNYPFNSYPYYPQQPVLQANPTVRLVTSREEVAAAQIPFDGSTAYFADTSNGKIYTKTFDFNTGTAPIVTYTREQEVRVQYATVEDLNRLRDELMGRVEKQSDE